MTKREVIRLRYCSVLQLLCEITCPLVTVRVMDHLKRKKKNFIYNHSDVFVGMMQDEIPEKEGICGTALLLLPRVPYSLGHFYA